MCILKVKVISLPSILQFLYVLCFTRPRYQVSVYRTIGHPVFLGKHMFCALCFINTISCLFCALDTVIPLFFPHHDLACACLKLHVRCLATFFYQMF